MDNQPVLVEALRGISKAPPPIWLMRQAGRYLPEYMAERQKFPDFMEFCFNSDVVTKVTLQPIERFDFDAAIIFSDILTIPHFLGQTVKFEKGHGPILARVEWDHFLKNGKNKDLSPEYQPLFKAIQDVKSALHSGKGLIGFAGSPWTIATYMIGGGKSKDFSEIVKFAETETEIFNEILDLLTDQVTWLLLGQIKAGCDVVQIFDSWAAAVPAQHREQWLWQPLRKIYNALKAVYPETPIIYYGKGVSLDYPKLISDLSDLCFGLDQSVDVKWAHSTIQKFAPVQGNLDPEKLVTGDFEKDVRGILENLSAGPFVFNLGHGILPATPIQHVYQLIELIRNQKF
ncbi:MAG: uroporphyrinogen decarboxylase [Alphaproteobacteria bacterium]|jgi:uroporphyrinogen decarboxylase|nr:uroporphyrinogen decarboxylase [Alphaproteobacteria bacterium]